ncbi:MAG: acyl-CoA thioesterase [Isosphaeraceae bacterium]
MRVYEYRHVVGFEETNLVGNVYFVNHLRWQGRCRELFLRDHAPTVLDEIERGLALVTTRVACEYYEELNALDEISIRMTLVSQAQNRLTMAFEYYRDSGGRDELVARGEQQIASMRRDDGRMRPVPIPSELREALRPYLSRLP